MIYFINFEGLKTNLRYIKRWYVYRLKDVPLKLDRKKGMRCICMVIKCVKQRESLEILFQEASLAYFFYQHAILKSKNKCKQVEKVKLQKKYQDIYCLSRV